MKVLKFGGKSLSNGQAIQNAVEIILRESTKSEVAVVVSARGQSTDKLIELYDLCMAGRDFTSSLNEFEEFQRGADSSFEVKPFIDELRDLLKALSLLKTDDGKVRDKILSFGEVLSAYTVADLLQRKGKKAHFVDSRNLIKVSSISDDVNVDMETSQNLTDSYFSTFRKGEIPVITGFIASDKRGNTVTLGRNGSNYSATLIANFINAEEVQNWTNIDGIYAANPKYVKGAQRINHLTYKEANELANFGAKILHSKTILPLVEKEIPLRILNSFEPDSQGTLIDKDGSSKGIKAVSVIEDVALISIEGNGLLGKVGIDARIFAALSRSNISVRLISQASSERGIGFIVNHEDAETTGKTLKEEFKEELLNGDISAIGINHDMSIVAIIGRHNYSLEKAIKGLRRNKIWLHLISNSISGEHISLVIDNKNLKKAVNVVHNQVFGAVKTLHLFAFGKGTVGGKLIDQILSTDDELAKKRNLRIKIIGVADSKKVIFSEDGIGENWREQLKTSILPNDLEDIFRRLKESALENIVIADNTSSQELTNAYPQIIKYGFDIVASNKKANSGDLSFYKELRTELNKRGRLFYYETNVGAGLPIIDTLKHLYLSSDKIVKIRGVFSGSLSYIFNHFSVENRKFSDVLSDARDKGFTEPDPREDLCGMDVARKLIILAREVGFDAEFHQVEIQNLIPRELLSIEKYDDFVLQKEALDKYYEQIKNNTSSNDVLRYVGELNTLTNTLKVSLVNVDQQSPLGNIKNADSLFEIYTEGYGEQPIVIQGAGAGSEVTARGVYSDLIRIGSLL